MGRCGSHNGPGPVLPEITSSIDTVAVLDPTPMPPEATPYEAPAATEDPDDERWESVRSFLEEMEKEKNAVSIWILWRKYKLSDKYKDADEYIRKHRTLEMMNGETEKIGELRKNIRSLLSK